MDRENTRKFDAEGKPNLGIVFLLATPAAPDIGLRIVEKYHTTAIYIHFA